MQASEDLVMDLRSHFGSSHFFSERAAFLVFVLPKCLQPSVVVSHFLMAHASDGTEMYQYLCYQRRFS